MVSWYLLRRTGGVYDSFEGTRDEVLAECASRNATDEQGSTEIVGQYNTFEEARDAFFDITAEDVFGDGFSE